MESLDKDPLTSELPALRARAEAAEKTVDVLSRRVLALYAGQGASTFERQLERSQKRQEEALRRRELIEVRAQALEKYSAGLERDVRERTRALRTILDNVTCGFLVIDRSQRVLAGYTASCHALLDQATIEGARLPDLLRADDNGWLRTCVEEVFDDVLSEALTLSQIPERFVIGDRVLRAEARAIREGGPDSPVLALLFTLTDITRQQMAERESRNQASLINILRQREAFRAFLADTRALLETALGACDAGDNVLLRRALHTIKGNAGCYDLHAVVTVVHAIEAKRVIARTDVEHVEAALRAYLHDNHDVLEIDLDTITDHVFEVSEAKVRALRSIADAHQGLPDVERWAAQVVLKRVDALLGPIQPFVEKLSSRLGKTVAFTLVGGETRVDTERFRPALQNLTHLLRNALDHGLEPPEERGAKPETGHLHLAILDGPKHWVIRLEDDGRGIDPVRLVQRALESGAVSPERAATMSAREKLELVFVDGLSTAREASEISGRGVGMSAVRAAVQPFGGDVEIESTVGVGTTVRIIVPKPHSLVEYDVPSGGSIAQSSSPPRRSASVSPSSSA